jgi:hypothetical protein
VTSQTELFFQQFGNRPCLLDGKPAKEVLTTMLTDHPDIVNDPVYLAALRNAHVDTSMIH